LKIFNLTWFIVHDIGSWLKHFLHEIPLLDLGVLVELNQSITLHELTMHHVKTWLNNFENVMHVETQLGTKTHVNNL
jgi:hypothetical protein